MFRLSKHTACRFAKKRGFSVHFGRAALCPASHVSFFKANTPYLWRWRYTFLPELLPSCVFSKGIGARSSDLSVTCKSPSVIAPVGKKSQVEGALSIERFIIEKGKML